MSMETTITLKCDRSSCTASTEENISDSTFGHFDITYQTSDNNSGVVSHDFCQKHSAEIVKALTDLGLLSPTPSAG